MRLYCWLAARLTLKVKFLAGSERLVEWMELVVGAEEGEDEDDEDDGAEKENKK